MEDDESSSSGGGGGGGGARKESEQVFIVVSERFLEEKNTQGRVSGPDLCFNHKASIDYV